MSFTCTNGRNTACVDGVHPPYIPAVGWVAHAGDPPRFTDDLLSVTVSLKSGRWFIAFQV